MNYIVEMNALNTTIQFCFDNELDAVDFLEKAFNSHIEAGDNTVVKFSIYREMP